MHISYTLTVLHDHYNIAKAHLKDAAKARPKDALHCTSIGKLPTSCQINGKYTVWHLNLVGLGEFWKLRSICKFSNKILEQTDNTNKQRMFTHKI